MCYARHHANSAARQAVAVDAHAPHAVAAAAAAATTAATAAAGYDGAIHRPAMPTPPIAAHHPPLAGLSGFAGLSGGQAPRPAISELLGRSDLPGRSDLLGRPELLLGRCADELFLPLPLGSGGGGLSALSGGGSLGGGLSGVPGLSSCLSGGGIPLLPPPGMPPQPGMPLLQPHCGIPPAGMPPPLSARAAIPQCDLDLATPSSRLAAISSALDALPTALMAPLAALGPPPQRHNHHNAIPPTFAFPHTDLMGPPGTMGMDGRAHHAGTMGPPMGPPMDIAMGGGRHGRHGGGMREFELAPAFDRSTVTLDYEDDVTPERLMGAAARPKSTSWQRAAGLAA